MIVARRLKGADHRAIIASQRRNEPIMLDPIVQHRQSPPASMIGRLNEDFVAHLGDIDRYQHGVVRDRLHVGHGRSLRNEDSNTVILETHRPAKPPRAARA
jgi:hypothetical protein